MDQARARFGARVTYVETPGAKFGRRPAEWADWEVLP
jgi:hypothetical protein